LNFRKRKQALKEKKTARDSGGPTPTALGRVQGMPEKSKNSPRAQDAPARPISSIKVGERHRRDLGDIVSLAASIDKIGLLHPVVITPRRELIAGHRRLQACKILGWHDIPVTIIDIDAGIVVHGELAENVHRKDFTPSEMVAIAAKVEERERELAKQRMTLGKISTGSDRGKTRDKIAAPLGISGRTLEKARAVMQAAQREPERFGALVADMDRTGNVTAAHRAMCKAEDEKRVLNLKPIKGKFRTIVLDSAWEYYWLSRAGRAKPGYATQSLDELRELDVRAWADEEAGCHLYCCVPNNFSNEAHKLVEHWGFQHRNVITWIKPPPFGLGSYFRNSTELVIFATLGETTTRPAAASIPTHFEAPRGEHSEKPEKFYEIVRAASYPPYGEGNQRKARPDFVNLYTEKNQTPEAAE
jgi:ParB/RepB/Spo0J family partition protein